MKTRTVSKWTTALALTVGGAMLATSAIAQSSAGSPPAKSSADTTKSDAPKADTSKSSAPQTDTSKSPAATTGSMGSEKKSDAKSDAMKSGPRDSAQSGDREQVKAVQQALKDKGHDPGEVDGAMGPKTEAALRDFQKKEGLKATGTADAETMAKLTASASMPAASPKDATSPAAKPTK
jgi:peptidoglycan hydrolase-like protein with peptidoglycan-binding domain